MTIKEVEENIITSQRSVKYCFEDNDKLDFENGFNFAVVLDSAIITEFLSVSIEEYDDKDTGDDEFRLIFRDMSGFKIKDTNDYIQQIHTDLLTHFSNGGHYNGTGDGPLKSIVAEKSNGKKICCTTLSVRGRTNDGMYDPTFFIIHTLSDDGKSIESYDGIHFLAEYRNDFNALRDIGIRNVLSSHNQYIFLKTTNSVVIFDTDLLAPVTDGRINSIIGDFVGMTEDEWNVLFTPIFKEIESIIGRNGEFEFFPMLTEQKMYYFPHMHINREESILEITWGLWLGIVDKYGYESEMVVPFTFYFDLIKKTFTMKIIKDVKKSIDFESSIEDNGTSIYQVSDNFSIRNIFIDGGSYEDWHDRKLVQTYRINLKTLKEEELNNMTMIDTMYPYVEDYITNKIMNEENPPDNIPALEKEHLLYVVLFPEGVPSHGNYGNPQLSSFSFDSSTNLVTAQAVIVYDDNFNEFESNILANVLYDHVKHEIIKVFNMSIDFESIIILSHLHASNYSYINMNYVQNLLYIPGEGVVEEPNPRGPGFRINESNIIESGNLRYRNKLLCHPDTTLEVVKDSNWLTTQTEYGPASSIGDVDTLTYCGTPADDARIIKKENVCTFMVQ